MSFIFLFFNLWSRSLLGLFCKCTYFQTFSALFWLSAFFSLSILPLCFLNCIRSIWHWVGHIGRCAGFKCLLTRKFPKAVVLISCPVGCILTWRSLAVLKKNKQGQDRLCNFLFLCLLCFSFFWFTSSSIHYFHQLTEEKNIRKGTENQ